MRTRALFASSSPDQPQGHDELAMSERHATCPILHVHSRSAHKKQIATGKIHASGKQPALVPGYLRPPSREHTSGAGKSCHEHRTTSTKRGNKAVANGYQHNIHFNVCCTVLARHAFMERTTRTSAGHCGEQLVLRETLSCAAPEYLLVMNIIGVGGSGISSPSPREATPLLGRRAMASAVFKKFSTTSVLCGIMYYRYAQRGYCRA